MQIILLFMFINIFCSNHIICSMNEKQNNTPAYKFNVITKQGKKPNILCEIWELPNDELDQDTITYIQEKTDHGLITTSVEIYTKNNRIFTQKNTIKEIESTLDDPELALEQNRELFEIDIEQRTHVYRDEEYRKQQAQRAVQNITPQILLPRIRPHYIKQPQSLVYQILNALLNADE